MVYKTGTDSSSNEKENYQTLVDKMFKSFEFNYWSLPFQRTGNMQEDRKKLEEIKDFWIKNISQKVSLNALKKGVEAIKNGHFHFNSKVPLLKEIIDFLRSYESKDPPTPSKIIKNTDRELNQQFLKDLLELKQEIDFLKEQSKNDWVKEEFVQFKNKMIYELSHSNKYKKLFDRVGHSIKINAKGEYVHDMSIYYTKK